MATRFPLSGAHCSYIVSHDEKTARATASRRYLSRRLEHRLMSVASLLKAQDFISDFAKGAFSGRGGLGDATKMLNITAPNAQAAEASSLHSDGTELARRTLDRYRPLILPLKATPYIPLLLSDNLHHDQAPRSLKCLPMYVYVASIRLFSNINPGKWCLSYVWTKKN